MLKVCFSMFKFFTTDFEAILLCVHNNNNDLRKVLSTGKCQLIQSVSFNFAFLLCVRELELF